MEIKSFSCDRSGCLAEFRLVPGEDDERYGRLMLEEHAMCPICNIQVLSPSFRHLDGYESRDITLEHLWLAVHGMGFPEQRTFNHTDVINLLKCHRVIKASATMIRTGRVMLNYLVLDNGKKLHFGDGATIYKIEEEDNGRSSQGLRDEDGSTGGEECAAGSEADSDTDVAAD